MFPLSIVRRTRTEAPALGAPQEALQDVRSIARDTKRRRVAGAPRKRWDFPVRYVSRTVVVAIQLTPNHGLRLMTVD